MEQSIDVGLKMATQQMLFQVWLQENSDKVESSDKVRNKAVPEPKLIALSTILEARAPLSNLEEDFLSIAARSNHRAPNKKKRRGLVLTVCKYSKYYVVRVSWGGAGISPPATIPPPPPPQKS